MLPYSRGLILDNANNYGIVKTEAVFGFGQRHPKNFVNVSYNNPASLEWLLTPVSLERRSLKVRETSRALENNKENETPTDSEKRHNKRKSKKKHGKKVKRKGKVKKCVFKILKKDKRNRRKNKIKGGGFKKKFLVPLILGVLAAKSVLIPIALKALAFMSAKGFLMGFFSTILASFLSIKGMFDHTHKYQDRKDEKTQVEIIQVPAKEEHYYDDHYKRGDFVPILN